LLASAFQLASIPSSISAAHGILHAPLELHHNGIKSHQTMVSQGLVRFFPNLVFLSFFCLVLIFFSFYFVFLFHIYRSFSIILCSPLIPCNYETTRVFYTLFVDFLACYGSHLLLAFLYISAPFVLLPLCFCHFYSVILFSFQFPPFKLCSMSCSWFLLHVSSIFHRLQSFSTVSWVKSCQTPLQIAMKLHVMRVVVWVSFPHCFNAISPIGLCLRVS